MIRVAATGVGKAVDQMVLTAPRLAAVEPDPALLTRLAVALFIVAIVTVRRHLD
jgi:hypothetical protein